MALYSLSTCLVGSDKLSRHLKQHRFCAVLVLTLRVRNVGGRNPVPPDKIHSIFTQALIAHVQLEGHLRVGASRAKARGDLRRHGQ